MKTTRTEWSRTKCLPCDGNGVVQNIITDSISWAHPDYLLYAQNVCMACRGAGFLTRALLEESLEGAESDFLNIH